MTKQEHIEHKEQKSIFTVAHFDYVKGLNTHAFYKIHDHDLGQDLVQDTFLKLWKYLRRGGKIDIMKAFLYHILNNLIIDEYRKRKSTSLDVLVEKGYEPSVDDTDHLFNHLDGGAALLMIQKLPEKYRKVINMRYVQGLSLAEMSLITGQTKNALAVQGYRGLEALKAIYKFA